MPPQLTNSQIRDAFLQRSNRLCGSLARRQRDLEGPVEYALNAWIDEQVLRYNAIAAPRIAGDCLDPMGIDWLRAWHQSRNRSAGKWHLQDSELLRSAFRQPARRLAFDKMDSDPSLGQSLRILCQQARNKGLEGLRVWHNLVEELGSFQIDSIKREQLRDFLEKKVYRRAVL